jgi:hypothetical protein
MSTRVWVPFRIRTTFWRMTRMVEGARLESVYV